MAASQNPLSDLPSSSLIPFHPTLHTTLFAAARPILLKPKQDSSYHSHKGCAHSPGLLEQKHTQAFSICVLFLPQSFSYSVTCNFLWLCHLTAEILMLLCLQTHQGSARAHQPEKAFCGRDRALSATNGSAFYRC